MKTDQSLAATPPPAPPTTQDTLLVSDMLTRDEIDALRQKKKQISDYAQKALTEQFKRLGMID